MIRTVAPSQPTIYVQASAWMSIAIDHSFIKIHTYSIMNIGQQLLSKFYLISGIIHKILTLFLVCKNSLALLLFTILVDVIFLLLEVSEAARQVPRSRAHWHPGRLWGMAGYFSFVMHHAPSLVFLIFKSFILHTYIYCVCIPPRLQTQVISCCIRRFTIDKEQLFHPIENCFQRVQ